jgi:hypothetical protein
MSANRYTGVDPDTRSNFEKRLESAAHSFGYPQTPDLVQGMKQRWVGQPVRRPARLAITWGIVILLFVLVGLFAVPTVRARVVDWIRLGAIRINLVEPTPAPTASVVLTAHPTEVLIPSLLNLAGETTLEDAKTKVGFDLRLPAYPSGLGQPDHVFLQDLGGPAVILVWVDKSHPNQVSLSLFELAPGTSGFEKSPPTLIQETKVNGVRALWTEGPHFLALKNGDMDLRQLVEGNTLIWVESGVTYRLETRQDLPEAIRIAESLK